MSGIRARAARIPGSKSLTNRALLLAAAADGTSVLTAPLVSDDTVAFREALTALGVDVDVRDDRWTVTGLGRAPRTGAAVWCADAGTAARFLPVLAAAGEGEFHFDGSDQLRARPLGPLTRALIDLGARVEAGDGGGLPLRITARGLAGGELALDSSVSSQYLTGLLLSAPLMREPLTVAAHGLVSRPYIDMTTALMRRFGAEVGIDAEGRLRVERGGYTGTGLRIEPDASTASYVFAAAAVTGTSVTVPHLGKDSLQGDLRFAEVLARTGAEVEIGPDATTVTGTGRLRGGFDVDMGDISDTFMTLAAVAPLADGPITVHGIRHARFKESDRITAIAANLRAGGVRVEEGEDRITVHPGRMAPTEIACHRDHRIAMAFSVLGLCTQGITLDDPGCVAKTFPGFHEELSRLFGPQASFPPPAG
ncbi:3-phosphoshikimate 1-carboxyvinyltransferase [Streptomyces sp. V4I23]|uniref:3-phosphoshikimate 1-carboxyvinyltransferase n=1 Tax=Streptomyces sp. V4I23 TaxID=3042282 RepID=UPI00278777A6|nr:3-phosphoshikimate 1-carboxyvinyltransferase [Streptomyces sp. V4I23]MDQ1009265.1 3-phosphoshikimate 1-carboxyvinyltransferase [Streptomyces sp. V4I23]